MSDTDHEGFPAVAGTELATHWGAKRAHADADGAGVHSEQNVNIPVLADSKDTVRDQFDGISGVLRDSV